MQGVRLQFLDDAMGFVGGSNVTDADILLFVDEIAATAEQATRGFAKTVGDRQTCVIRH
ncbi:hypothetical protein [Ochrobactrum chromiisoli]|uniref:Uncharacterized protein n=1 Tax=Ochrobactrum chromiisoli TaxID=2993941 RepID=A0ABT3QKQ6_9HYPH|nr:hypothetical protein [Ochrobactrum chromiisoli]MCX2696194.1 hypothetical protein [Ochrobactrum chromiisoli]